MQVEEASAAYKEAVRLSPRFAEAHCNLGVLHKGAGRLAEAIACYEAACRPLLDCQSCLQTWRPPTQSKPLR